jgi:hypothetical protein
MLHSVQIGSGSQCRGLSISGQPRTVSLVREDPPDDLAAWALAAVGGNRLTCMTGLRGGGAPWLMRYETDGRADAAVVRVGASETARPQNFEVHAMAMARSGGDAAMSYGLDASDHVLDGWQREAQRPALSLAYWDIVAALSTPPDIDWFAGAIADMNGRPTSPSNCCTSAVTPFSPTHFNV